MKEGRGAFKILTDKPMGKGPPWRPRRRWEDNIRMNHKEIDVNMRNFNKCSFVGIHSIVFMIMKFKLLEAFTGNVLDLG